MTGKRRLRKLRIDRVDRVDAPANPGHDGDGARIVLFKRAERVAKATKTEDGKAFPPGDYAHVPDPDMPSTWKLRLTSTPGGKPDPRIVGAAIAALGPGFRGQKVDIPESDMGAVKARVMRAWMAAHPDMTADEAPDVLKSKESQMSDTATIEDLQSQIATLTVERDYVMAVGKSLEDRIAELAKTDEPTPIDKDSLPAEVRKALEETEALRETVAKMKADADRAEWIGKAAEFDKLGSPTELGSVLADIAAHCTEDTGKAVERIFKAAVAVATDSEKFREIGKSGKGGDAFDRLKAAAEEIRKDNPSFTEAQAIDMAARSNPDLVAAYRAART